MNKFTYILLCLVMAGCATTGKKISGVEFFSGRAADDCDFLGYIESESTKSSEDASYDDARYEILKQAQHYHANAVKFISVNRVITKINLSAEAYKCPSLVKLKITDENHLNFDQQP